MTDTPHQPASRGSLRDEAADWFALMRGPDAERRRAEFEAWLDGHAIHREAYNRIAETFSLGKALKGAGLDEKVREPFPPATKSNSGRRAWATAFLLIAVAGAVMIWGAVRQNQSFAPRPQLAQKGSSQQRLATRIGEIMEFRLADGSIATLDTDSLVEVSYRNDTRGITLMRGRARFSVAHEARPFLVTAGNGTVRAVGTIFDVRLAASGKVDVRLIKGVVLVDATGRTMPGGQMRRLDAGQTLAFGGPEGPKVTILGKASDANWPAGVRDFDSVRVADVFADANRYAKVPLRAATPDIADTRISGAFRIDDGPALAANIADVLGLAEVTEAGVITLARECPPSLQENCRPPS